MTPATGTCPTCGAVALLVDGLCPDCRARRPAAGQAPLRAGDVVGRYRILEPIGEGGCGMVFQAEQCEPVRRLVAVKVIKLGMDTRSVIGRFEAERQALALMDHPNIARVLDAGATAAGRPYFVMELLRGLRITDYCDRDHLATHDRLSLFVQVCNGIQHAHEKGIIHRDIKPSNILVTTEEGGGAGVPKVIDFGIAQATNGQVLTDKTLFTAFEQFLGTPAYMSPEQTEWGGAALDSRSDIYSLGILLYELLTGTTPFAAEKLRQAGLDEVRRIIREEEPQPPSTRLRAMAAAEASEIARQRRAEPPRLIHLIRGDLDWVVLKALEKDREHRYPTAAEFAQDIQRYLQDRPVSAAAPSRLRHFRKFVRRQKFAVRIALALGVALSLALGVSAWLLGREQAARRRAVAAEQVQARFRMETKLNQLADLVAQLRTQGRLAEAEISYRHLIELQRKLLGNEQPQVADSLENLAGVLKGETKLAQAEAMYREALALREKQMPDDWHTFNLRSQLGACLLGQGKLRDAEPLVISSGEGLCRRESAIPASEKPLIKEALQRVVELYDATARPAKAAEWRLKLTSIEPVTPEANNPSQRP